MNFNQTSEKPSFSGYLSAWPYLLIPCLLATWLYAPALFGGKIQIFGDSMIHSLSVLEFNRKMLHEGVSPLWTDLLYGGHPYFAEGQGGFFNPLNFLVALLFNPVTGQNIYHWLSMMIGALGVFSLCRHFRCGREASTFGSLVVVFSAFWIQFHDNLTIAGALCWVPWVFLCFERWIDHPSGQSALWLGLSVSLLIFAGYPQIVHGAVIFMAVSLIPTLFSGFIGSRRDNSLKQYALTGLVAVAACVGLSAVQWIPLLELVSWSHRSGGTNIPFPIFFSWVLRGFLFSASEQSGGLYRGAGSVFACFVAALSVISKPNHRITGHIISSIFMIILGLGFLNDSILVPGLKFFRGVHIYLGVSIIGIGLLGSIAIEGIQKQITGLSNPLKKKTPFLAGTTVMFLICLGVGLRVRVADVSILQYLSLVVAYLLMIVCILINKQRWLGHALLVLLAMEILMLRIPPVPFSDPKLIAKPLLVQYLHSDNHHQDYKIMNLSGSLTVGMMTLWDTHLEEENRKAFMRVAPSTNVLWNIPSIDANLALPLAQHKMIQPKLKEEISGTDRALPGTRMIDYLGIRYINTEKIFPAAGLSPLMMDGIIILENKYALPRVQTFTRYEMAGSSEDALNRIKKSKETTLILEPPLHQTIDKKKLPPSTEVNDPQVLKILSSKQSNVQYAFDVQAIRPAWLFIADANYPGWQARIDGRTTPVYSAQVLGKAVLVPAGRHQITVEFKSRSFAIGLAVMIFTVLVLLIAGIRTRYFKKASSIAQGPAC